MAEARAALASRLSPLDGRAVAGNKAVPASGNRKRAAVEPPNPLAEAALKREAGKLLLSERNSTALFGAGLLDSIPDELITAGATNPRVPEATRGRVSVLADGRLGRFGWQASQATLEDFGTLGLRTGVGNRRARPRAVPQPAQSVRVRLGARPGSGRLPGPGRVCGRPAATGRAQYGASRGPPRQ